MNEGSEYNENERVWSFEDFKDWFLDSCTWSYYDMKESFLVIINAFQEKSFFDFIQSFKEAWKKIYEDTKDSLNWEAFVDYLDQRSVEIKWIYLVIRNPVSKEKMYDAWSSLFSILTEALWFLWVWKLWKKIAEFTKIFKNIIR